MQEFDAEEKFNEDLNEIKDKINECKLSEEFKSNLQEKLEIEYNKDTAKKEKNKKIIFPTISRKLATVAACFVLFFSGCVTFADEIECWVEKIFSNTDRIVERAIANGNYKEIDMEYVEDNGVSIKVDYLVVEEDSMYIAFNVLTEDEFDKVYLNDFKILNQDNYILYSKDVVDKINIIWDEKMIKKKNCMILGNLKGIQYNMNDIRKINIEILKVDIQKENEILKLDGNWNIEFSI